MTGFLLEQHNDCTKIIRLWLIGAFIRCWLRMFVQFMLASLTGQSVDNYSVRCAYMYQEGLDVFGVIWFVLMSIVVFNNSQCLAESPIQFAGCLAFLLGCYFYIIIYFFILRSLAICPPSSPEDIQYLADLRQAAIDLRNQLSNAPGTNPLHTSPPPQIDPNSWGAWLETYGSYAIPYEKTDHGTPHRSRANTGDTERNMSVGSADSAGDVELGLVPTAETPPSSTAHAPSTLSSLSFASLTLDREALATAWPGESHAQTVHSHPCINTESCAICLGNFVSPDEASQSSESQKNNHIIVRYPCPGNHYFHAHCLHRWLQSDVVRRAQSRRPVVRSADRKEDVRDLVTCPICREHPTVNINAFKHTSTEKEGGEKEEENAKESV